MENLITMANKEVERYDIVKQLIDSQISAREAGTRLSLSVRQIKRIKARVKKSGARGAVHGLRGRASNRAIDSETKEKALNALRSEYADFGPTLATEKLAEVHSITLHESTVRAYMIEEGLWKVKPRKTSARYHAWRPRKEMYGEMEQFDGSYHNWFEGRAEEKEYCLLAAIDDASGDITRAVFGKNEGVESVFQFWKGYVEEKGKPKSLYLDKYSTYKVNHKHAVDNSDLITQFERGCQELDVQLITAHSPQAKGRVERLFKTLQDRLVKEMRLRDISDVETANQFLEKEFIPAFNKKYGVMPVKKGNAHRNLTKQDKEHIDSIFSIRSERVVANDFTVRFKNMWYQLHEEQSTTVLRRDHVIIEERLDGSTHIRLRGKELFYTALPERPEKKKERITALAPKRKSSWKPAQNHPWRQCSRQKNKRC
jgi:transposase